MPRMRTLKPGFFTNEELAELPPLTRLLFAGLWCLADREGRLEDRPKRIKAAVLPYDHSNVPVMLSNLAAKNFIQRYEVEGERYIQICNFAKHQNPNVKEPQSTIPAPCQHHDGTVPPPNGHHAGTSSRAGALSHGLQEQEQEPEARVRAHARNGMATIEFSPTEREVIDAVCAALKDFGFRLEPRLWRKVITSYPGIDLEAEAYKQADWLRRNRIKNCSAARYTNWLDKAHPKVTAIRPAHRIIDRTGVAN